jgi:hypothetical protein
MTLIGTVGYIGGLMFLIKIAVHVYIKRKIDKKFNIGPSGSMLNPILFLPIFDDVVGSVKALKTVGNCIYFASIMLILIFVVGANIH